MRQREKMQAGGILPRTPSFPNPRTVDAIQDDLDRAASLHRGRGRRS